MKRTMDIEAVLRWAYREELPKALGSANGPSDSIRPGWAGISSYAQLLAVIDYNRYGVLPDLTALDAPHVDAVRVFDAVRALDGCAVEVPDAWDPLGDMPEIGDDAASLAAQALQRATYIDQQGQRHFRGRRQLVERFALMGGCPVWEMDVPERKVERQASTGQPAWFIDRVVYEETCDGRVVERTVTVEGYNHTRRRPYPGAYQRTYLEPDPVPGIIGRIEYELWHAALALLVEDLADGLESIALTPCARPARPWEDGQARAPRILPSALSRAAALPPPRFRARRKNKIAYAA
ncbi:MULTISPECIES: hypothetical protein [unclassified Chelatococcus]|uniref:hypothetical protein n=1 Tax=unclassified Chelatococcus TaxID=2638111 RepID=UPI001BD058FD|nr:MULTISPECIES: hypothetical protein [unclassified Chelatococcus]MBS7699182.1 hypothetical protein [Chelatococcus sp. YT9]MBX3554963.1 hypothetical protein [Chelatococcus sp.]